MAIARTDARPSDIKQISKSHFLVKKLISEFENLSVNLKSEEQQRGPARRPSFLPSHVRQHIQHESYVKSQVHEIETGGRRAPIKLRREISCRIPDALVKQARECFEEKSKTHDDKEVLEVKRPRGMPTGRSWHDVDAPRDQRISSRDRGRRLSSHSNHHRAMSFPLPVLQRVRSHSLDEYDDRLALAGIVSSRRRIFELNQSKESPRNLMHGKAWRPTPKNNKVLPTATNYYEDEQRVSMNAEGQLQSTDFKDKSSSLPLHPCVFLDDCPWSHEDFSAKYKPQSLMVGCTVIRGREYAILMIITYRDILGPTWSSYDIDGGEGMPGHVVAFENSEDEDIELDMSQSKPSWVLVEWCGGTRCFHRWGGTGAAAKYDLRIILPYRKEEERKYHDFRMPPLLQKNDTVWKGTKRRTLIGDNLILS